jgi:hypothetical protein
MGRRNAMLIGESDVALAKQLSIALSDEGLDSKHASSGIRDLADRQDSASGRPASWRTRTRGTAQAAGMAWTATCSDSRDMILLPV